MKFGGFLKIYEEGKDQSDEEDEELKHKLPAVTEGETTQVPADYARAALHRTAAALQRGYAGEKAGSRRGRPAFHICLHHLHHSGARVREEGGRPVHSDRVGQSGHRPADRELRRYLRRQVHRPHGRGAGRDRRGPNRLARGHRRVLREVRQRSEARRRAHDRHQADGAAHRLDLREVRQAPGDQVGPPRQLHRLHRISRLHLHARTDGGSAGCGQGRIWPSRATKNTARTAAGPWC